MRFHGIITDVSGLQCGVTINSFGPSDSVESNEARNEKGLITDIWAYSVAHDISVQGVVDDEKGTLVAAGAKLTVGGRDFLITNVDKPEECTAFYEATFQLHTADNAEIHVYVPPVVEGA